MPLVRYSKVQVTEEALAPWSTSRPKAEADQVAWCSGWRRKELLLMGWFGRGGKQ